MNEDKVPEMAIIIVVLAIVGLVQVITLAVVKGNFGETMKGIEQGCEKQGEFVLNDKIYKCQAEVR